MLESTFHEDWDKIGSNRAKKGHLLLKSTIFSKLAGCQWVNVSDLKIENLTNFIMLFPFLISISYYDHFFMIDKVT